MKAYLCGLTQQNDESEANQLVAVSNIIQEATKNFTDSMNAFVAQTIDPMVQPSVPEDVVGKHQDSGGEEDMHGSRR